MDALHHPGQLLLLQLPLLLPGLRGARGPLSARCASTTRPRLHSAATTAAAAAAAPRAPRSLPGPRRWGRRRQQQRQQPEEAGEPELRPRGAVSSQVRKVIGELRRAGWKWKGPRTNGQRAAAERRVVWEGASKGGGESTGLLARPRPGCCAEEPGLPRGGGLVVWGALAPQSYLLTLSFIVRSSFGTSPNFPGRWEFGCDAATGRGRPPEFPLHPVAPLQIPFS